MRTRGAEQNAAARQARATINSPLDDSEVRRLLAEIKLDLLRLQCWRKANFNPNQPRLPAGNPDGGQWTSEGGSGQGDRRINDPRVISDTTPSNGVKPGTRFAAREGRRRPPGSTFVRIGEKLVAVDPDQSFRLDVANRQANEAIGRVRQVEPEWQPRTSAYELNIEGKIREAKDLILEAEARLVELGHQTPARVIQIYRDQHHAVDLFGRELWPRDDGVVAFTISDKLPIFGTNSDAPPYRGFDRTTADTWRGLLLDRYPDEMETGNIDQIPNDALYHAEATVLLRAARANGGSLSSRVMEVYVDTEMCRTSCPIVLPLLGAELGNPVVTFVGPSGERRTMRDGGWDR
ncbi:MAG: hypothetical protein ACRECO_13790 [Xanthobacteraceae bacterium]